MDAMPLNVRIRLSVMMFLQYLMFAVWWVPLAAYLTKLGIEGNAKAWILSVMPLGCLIARSSAWWRTVTLPARRC